MNDYNDFKTHMRKIADIVHSMAVLNWDKEVNLPKNGVAMRSQQLATLSGIAHELFTDNKFGGLLNKLSIDNSLGQKEKKNIAITLDDYNKSTKFEKDFVIRRSQLISKAYHAWIESSKANNFEIYIKPLDDLVRLKREEANILGYDDHPYDALLDLYEPGAKVKDLDVLFANVKSKLVPFLKKIRKAQQVDNSFLKKHYNKDDQWDFGIDLLENMGYDFNGGRQDISPHPFTTSFAANDVRVTTRIDENDFANMCWSTIHEGGHALYEQGLNIDDYGLATGGAISLGIHESQSRLWENHVGRSFQYWKYHYHKLQAKFSDNLKDISLLTFYNGINKVEANYIRTEADELHYHFHVMIRYEIEKILINGELEVKDLKKVWNHKYQEYMDLEFPDDKNGILQDVHWGHGSFGYFPTYSLGSFYAAQFYSKAVNDSTEMQNKIEEGDMKPLLDWLREKIHKHGRLYEASELCERITGEKLNFNFFMDYAEAKYKEIYNMA